MYRALMDLDRMREIACGAVEVGSSAVLSGRAPAAGEAKGAPGDWVTEVDLASERAISAYLERQTPDVPVHGEELGGVSSGLRWVVDPLDGTTNYVHGFWAVGVSVGLWTGPSRWSARSGRRSWASSGTGRPGAAPHGCATAPSARAG